MAIIRLARLKPDYLDIEYGWQKIGYPWIQFFFPHSRYIYSWHQPEACTLKQAEIIYQKMQKNTHCFGYKIAYQVHNTQEALALLHWKKKKNDPKLTVIAMGQYGSMTRILSQIFGNQLLFVPAEKNTAAGQLTLNTLINTYNIQRHNTQTKIFALIGQSIDQSIGSLWHNQYFKEQQINAVYIKCPLAPQELQSFLQQALALGFQGLSVTMPYKQAILPHVNPTHLPSCNTLYRNEKNQWQADNTDMISQLICLKLKTANISEQRICLLGSGGTALSVAYCLHQLGNKLTVITRHPEKVPDFFKENHIACYTWAQCTQALIKKMQIIIHCTPMGMNHEKENNSSPLNMFIQHLEKKHLVIDFVYAQERQSTFIQAAKEKGCQIIDGHSLFVKQAQWQQSIWCLMAADVSIKP